MDGSPEPLRQAHDAMLQAMIGPLTEAVAVRMNLHHSLVRSRVIKEPDGLVTLILTQDLDEVTLRMTEASLKALVVTLLLAFKAEVATEQVEASSGHRRSA